MWGGTLWGPAPPRPAPPLQHCEDDLPLHPFESCDKPSSHEQDKEFLWLAEPFCYDMRVPNLGSTTEVLLDPLCGPPRMILIQCEGGPIFHLPLNLNFLWESLSNGYGVQTRVDRLDLGAGLKEAPTKMGTWVKRPQRFSETVAPERPMLLLLYL